MALSPYRHDYDSWKLTSPYDTEDDSPPERPRMYAKHDAEEADSLLADEFELCECCGKALADSEWWPWVTKDRQYAYCDDACAGEDTWHKEHNKAQ